MPSYRSARRKVVVTLTLMPGAEPWILVTHDTGRFKLPATSSLQEAFRGAVEGWTGRRYRAGSDGVATVRVPLSDWLELHANGQRSGCS